MKKEFEKGRETFTGEELWQRITEEMSEENMCAHMEVLVEQIGERLSGTEELARAAAYIEDQLRDQGMDARTDRFPMYHSFPGKAQLKVLSPRSISVDARPMGHISATPVCGVTGEMIYLGMGGYEDYEGVDAGGKIVLTDMNWNPSRPEKARIAWEKGAKALIIMNWGKAEDPLIQMGAVKSQWGNPTPESFLEIPQIPVISVSRAAGEELKALCQDGREPVRVWLQAEATRQWVEACQPTVRIKGGRNKSGQFVLVGSHLDAWGKSAICNASGNALAMEMARLFHKHRGELKKDIQFIFWDGHEIAEGGGSTWYCDTHWQDLSDNCVAYINIDNLAIKGTSEPGVESQPELKAFLMDSIRKVWGREGVWNHAYKGGGDSSFFGVGVPYISFATEYTEDMLKELNHAFYSPWLHSDSDTVDKIDQELYRRHFLYFSYILCVMIQQDRLPYDLEALAADVEMQVAQVIEMAGENSSKIKELSEMALRYSQAARAVEQVLRDREMEFCSDGWNEPWTAADQVLRAFERSSAPFRCFSGRYGQDGCGWLKTEKPVPALWDALLNLNLHDEGSHQYNLWLTKVLREKNRVWDAMNEPVHWAEFFLRHCAGGKG